MPTFLHGKTTAVLVDEFDMSGYFNNVDFSMSLDTAETTAFAASAKAYIPGLKDATLSVSGMFSQDATVGSDVVLAAALGSTTTPVVTVVQGTGTIGNRCVLGRAHETSYATSNPVGDVVSISADFNASTDGTANQTLGLASGVILTTGASIAYGSLGALSSVDNTASSASGGMATLHASTNTIAGGATTVLVQHSADNSTWATLITFTAISASTTTKQLSAVSGTVNRYLRASASTAGSSGSIIYNVGFARF